MGDVLNFPTATDTGMTEEEEDRLVHYVSELIDVGCLTLNEEFDLDLPDALMHIVMGAYARAGLEADKGNTGAMLRLQLVAMHDWSSK